MSRSADATSLPPAAPLDCLVALGRGLAGASPDDAPAIAVDILVPALADLAIVAVPEAGRLRLAAVRHRALPDEEAAGLASALLPAAADGNGGRDPAAGDAPAVAEEPWRASLRAAFGASDSLLLPLDGVPGGLLALARADDIADASFDPRSREIARAAADALAAALAGRPAGAPDPPRTVPPDAWPDFAWGADSAGTPVWANHHAGRYAGGSGTGRPAGWRPEIHPDDREAAERDWRRSLADGDAARGERRLRMADGSWRWHLGRSGPMREADGRSAGWLGVETDIHAHREAEGALAADLARSDFLAALRDRLDQVTDPGQTFAVAAADLRRLFGATLVNLNELLPDGMVAVTVSGEGNIVPDGDYRLDQVHSPAVRAALAAGEPVAIADVRREPIAVEQWEAYAAHGVIALLAAPVVREGRWVGTLVVGAPEPRAWRDDEIRLVQAVVERVWVARERVGLVRDLAAAAARLRESREEARRQLAELEAIYATAPVGLGTLDRELRFVRINERLAELNGVPAAEHLGRTVREILPRLADDAEPLLRRVLESGEPLQDIEIVGETPAAPGVERAWLEQWSPIRNGDGETIGINIVAEEITERKRAEDERIAFTRAVVHDVRNPLTVIQGAAQLLQIRAERGVPDPLEIDESMDAVIAAVARSLDVLDDLLDAAHLRAGRPVELRREPCDLAEIAVRVAASLRAGAPRHEIAVEADPGAGDGQWDRRRMERAIANLLENAVKYSPDGGRVTVRLARETGPDGPVAVLAVADEGIGIRPEDLPHLFEPFRRGGNVAGLITGHGIGLSGVKQIVDLHGGTISAESREGAGSTFTVRLPLGAPAGTAAATHA